MGKLYVVATPIGNLGDVTYRAVETLHEVDLILAEDTRQTQKLLNRYDIKTPTSSYHVYSRNRKRDQILAELDEGRTMALVTDAGTPAVADPGSVLVEQARRRGHEIIPIPGPTAVATALSAVGLGGDEFTFLGFLPHKKGRQTRINGLGGLIMPVVLYESPRRLVKLLGELEATYPEAQVCVARELTKKFEEFRVGTPAQLRLHYEDHPPKGEIVVVVRT